MRQLLLLLFLAVSFISAQVNFQLIVRVPTPPLISDWQKDPSIIMVNLFNTSSQSYPDSYLSIKISDMNGKVVAATEDYDPKMPKFNIPASGNIVLNGPQLINGNAVSFDKGLRSKVLFSNSLPEGEYELCMRLLDRNGKEIGMPSEICRTISILMPDPPSLIMPVDDDEIQNVTPVFTWSPVIGASPLQQISYRLRIAPVYQGQSAAHALNSNQLLADKKVSGNSYVYMPTDIQFSVFPDAVKFAWQVQALDKEGNPATRLKGLSEIGTFRIKKLNLQFIPQNQITLESPLKNAEIENLRPVFKWKYNSLTTSDFEYFLRVTEIKAGQTPESSMNGLSSVYTAIIPRGSNSHIPAVQLQLENNRKYCWMVEVRSKTNYSAVASSEIAGFTFKNTILGAIINSMSTVNGNLNYQFADIGEYIGWPLKDANIKLQIKYVLKIKSTTSTGGQIKPLPPGASVVIDNDHWSISQFADRNKVLGTRKTGANGDFSIEFFNPGNLGEKIISNLNYGKSYGEFQAYYTGDVYRVARIVLEAPHSSFYMSPETDIILSPGEIKTYNLFPYVRSFGLNVNVSAQEGVVQYSTGNLTGMEVYILRKKNKSGMIPKNEGAPIKRNPADEIQESPAKWGAAGGYEIMASGLTDINGNVYFGRMVRTLNAGDKYYLYTKSPDNEGSKIYAGFREFIFNNTDDRAVFNDEYIFKTPWAKITAQPGLPRVAGTIKRSDSQLPLGSANVSLQKEVNGNWIQEKGWVTYYNGAFDFKNLSVQTDNGNPVGPKRSLWITKPGFFNRFINVPSDGSILKPGRQWINTIMLDPALLVRGEIVNESGSGVKTRVSLENGGSVEAVPKIYIAFQNKWSPAKFELKSGGGQQKLIIDPTPWSQEYFKDTISFNQTGAIHDFEKIVLKKKEHRLDIYVIRHFSGFQLQTQTVKIAGAYVKVKTQFGKIVASGKTDSQGNIKIKFINSAEDFIIQVEAPEGEYYESKSIIVKNKESKDYLKYGVSLKKASYIKGYVTVGENNQPVSAASVRVSYANSENKLETYTDQNGFFTLKNVPVNTLLKFLASKSSSNLTGDQKILTVPESGSENINFRLKVYEGMDITNILGFPIAVDNLSESGNSVYISGRFVKLDSLKNVYFAPGTSEAAFSEIKIVPGNTTRLIYGVQVPVSKPAVLPVKTLVNSIDLVMLDTYYGEVRDEKLGIEMNTAAGEKGVIKGEVFIGAGSFNIPSQSLDFKEGGFFASVNPGFNKRIDVITADPSAMVTGKNKYSPLSSSGKSVQYNILGFDAVADSSKSFIRKDSLTLNTIIHTMIENTQTPDINLNLGNITVLKNHIKPIKNSKNKFEIKLDNWKISASEWSFENGLAITNGILKTGIVDVPLRNLTITPTQLLYPQLELKSMSIGGIIPINVKTDPVFGYDQTRLEWFLSAAKAGQSCAAFGGLPGMIQGDSIQIEYLALYSKGKTEFTPSFTQTPVRLYDVGILRPDMITFFEQQNIVEIAGLGFDIPDINLNTAAYYYKDAGKVKFKMMPTSFILETKGIRGLFGMNNLHAATQQLDLAGLKAKGTLSEYKDGQYIFRPSPLDVWLYHTKDSTSVVVETPPIAQKSQKLYIGGTSTYLDDVSGRMFVESGTWDYFRFGGNLKGTKGIEGTDTRINFTLKGEITAEGQKLSVKNVNTPFGNMKWTYEFENSRLIGSMDINQDIGGIKLTGSAETRVDESGWYFIAGGLADLPGTGPVNAAILFGDYPEMPQSVKTIFANSSYNKNLPSSFEKSISGFLFGGALEVPIIVPEIDVNVIVAEAKFGVTAGGDIRLWKNFTDSGNEMGIGFISFLHAYLNMESITCTELHADAKLELGFTGIYYLTQKSFSLSGCGSFSITGGVKQGIPFCDLDGCGCTTVIDESISKAFKAEITIDSGGAKSLGFGLGSCSGN